MSISDTPKSPLAPHVREEIANIALHGLGLFLSLIGFGVLVAFATLTRSPFQIVGASIYGASLLMLYFSSVLFHTSLAIDLTWKKALETLDHCAIYLLIAGSYTPFFLVTLHGKLGWWMLALVWALALSGILYKVFFFYSSDLLSTLAYIAMGWLAVLIVYPLWLKIGWAGVGMLLLGGLFYTFGALFYLFDDRFRFAHAVWHLCVLAGSICHYLTVLWFIVLA